MATEAARELETKFEPGSLFKAPLKKAADVVKSTHTDEMVIVLCGPIGTPLHYIASELERILRDRFAYQTTTIRLSAFIQKYANNIPNKARYERVKHLIAEGDRLRKEHGGSVLAELAIREISLARNNRKEAAGADRYEPARVCHIIDSIKNQEELDILRLVYRDMLHCVGVVSPLDFRVKKLEEDMKKSEIFDLIDQDSGEEIAHGQTVRDTFPQADFFLRVDTDVADAIEKKIERYLNIALAAKIETPTPNETAMYLAASAATNSACLSRQVGAAITDKQGDVLAIGWNDVPSARGGLYTTADANSSADVRCKNVGTGECHNDKIKAELAKSVVTTMIGEQILQKEYEAKAVEIVRKSRVGDLIEFSRAIHAEMYALIKGAQKTADRMVGGRLFCTTYPCHSCARHIIMAGIMEVYYVEPYRKSLATRLHGDAISEDEKDTDKVRILPFDGVSPNRYLQLFSMGKGARKKDGRTVRIDPRDAELKAEISLESLPVLEGTVVKNLLEKKLDENPAK